MEAQTKVVFVCSICYKQYDDTKDLREHMISFHKLREKQPKLIPSVSFDNFKLFLRKNFSSE